MTLLQGCAISLSIASSIFLTTTSLSSVLTIVVREYPRVMLRSLGRLLSMGYYYLVSCVPILSIFFLSCVVLAMPVYLK